MLCVVILDSMYCVCLCVGLVPLTSEEIVDQLVYTRVSSSSVCSIRNVCMYCVYATFVFVLYCIVFNIVRAVYACACMCMACECAVCVCVCVCVCVRMCVHKYM